VLGLPAISVPGGSRDGLPRGIQLAGRKGADSLLLGIAAALAAT
jgi:Asp-tRNA(Asn)/Glu-tRNA(Gln) amidotransferase A subunit family amidase